MGTFHGMPAILVPVGVQPVTRAELHLLMEAVARDDGLAVHTLTSGLTPEGLDLGSPSARPLEAPRPVIVVGGGASSYEAGEVWHQLDARWRQPVPPNGCAPTYPASTCPTASSSAWKAPKSRAWKARRSASN